VVLAASRGVSGGAARRIFQIVRREKAYELADHGQTIGIVARNKMGDATFSL